MSDDSGRHPKDANQYLRDGLATGLCLSDLMAAMQRIARAHSGSEAPFDDGSNDTVDWPPSQSIDRPPFPNPTTTTVDWQSSASLSSVVEHAPSPFPSKGKTPVSLPDPVRYEDLGLLGQGGMGEVRRVLDRQLGRTLALKVLHRRAQQQPEIAARFLEEAQATAQLQHPGIIPIYDQGTLRDGRLWFLMKEVAGDTLTEVIQGVHDASPRRWEASPSGWTLRRLVDALRRVCEAMAHAHERGVVHRDLKPSNIMTGAHGEVLILDWGLAKVIGTALVAPRMSSLAPVRTDRSRNAGYPTIDGQIAGTPAYMPPEQARGENQLIDGRSDVYSIGAILYQVLTGRAPYHSPSARETLRQVLHGPPPSLVPGEQLLETVGLANRLASEAHRGPPLPPALVLACQRAMAREPADRYQTADALGHELTEWLDGVKRQDEARVVVERARVQATQVAQFQAKAAQLRQTAAEVMAGIAPWESEDNKLRGWKLEDAATDFARLAELADLEEEQLLQASLTHAPQLPEAHAALAAKYRAAHQAAEQARQDSVRSEVLLQQHVAALPFDHPERLAHLRYLQGDGSLSIATDPPGAEVLLHRYVGKKRRLVPVFERSLGTTPIGDVPLPMGSYLCILKHTERAEVRYPVFIERQQHWDGVPPEGGPPVAIPLPFPGELGPSDRYVPPGWFWSGQSTQAARSLPKRRLWVDGRVFRCFPVTNADYLSFLDGLVAQGRTEDALQHAPRERSGTVGESGAQIYGFDGRRFSLRPDADGDVWEPDVPVFMVDWAGAAAFAAWEAGHTGQPWRLPCELAWEKAARGVDGRVYPWGDRFDPSWTCMRNSHSGRMLPQSVHAFPVDESPYMIRGMAGNAADWCVDAHREHPLLTSRRVPAPIPSMEPANTRQTRGGGWYSEAVDVQLTGRHWNAPASRTVSLGFRLARTLREPLS